MWFFLSLLCFPQGAKTSIRALEFSSDGRWILAASTDGAVLVWDVPAARLLQTMRMSADSPVVGLSLSPAMDMLATVHEGRRGVYLWANSQMYSAAPSGGVIGAGAEDGEEERDVKDKEEEGEEGGNGGVEVAVHLPRLHAEIDDAGEIVLGASLASGEEEEEKGGGGGGGGSGGGGGGKKGATGGEASVRPEVPEPVAPGMATMALLPRTQWMGLLHLETIRERNKPIAPPEKPKEAPFFLPTTASLERNPVFDVEAEQGDEDEDGGDNVVKSRILTVGGDGGGDVEGVLLRLLRRGKIAAEAEEDAAIMMSKSAASRGRGRGKKRGGGGSDKHIQDDANKATGGPYAEVMAHLRKQGPSALDAEIRALGPWDVSVMSDADADELADVLDFFAAEIPSGRNFELLHALLAHFLRVHGAAITDREELRTRAERVRAAARNAWSGLDQLLQEVRCALGFFGGQHGQ